MLKPLCLALAMSSVALLAGCETMPKTTAESTENLQLLQNRTWIATQIGNTVIQTSPQARNIPSIQFDEATKRVSGADGCNRIMGSYSVKRDTLQLSQMASTRMACMNNNNIDRDFNDALAKVTHYKTIGKNLQLLDRYGNPVLKFELAVQPR